MKHYTSIEQSIHLEKLGLDIMTADMFYNEEPDENYPKDIIDTKYPMVIREGQKHHLLEYGVPCWSLSALLELLPIITKKLHHPPSLTKAIDGSGYFIEYPCYPNLPIYVDKNPINVAYKAIIWLIKNGYIKTNK